MTHNVLPVRTYVTVFVVLICLTGLTVFAARMDLGALAMAVALVIAGVKTTLVMLWFMEVKFSEKLIKIIAGAGFFWLAILIALSLADYLTRDWPTLPTR